MPGGRGAPLHDSRLARTHPRALRHAHGFPVGRRVAPPHAALRPID
jgi:hypothetical protein